MHLREPLLGMMFATGLHSGSSMKHSTFGEHKTPLQLCLVLLQRGAQLNGQQKSAMSFLTGRSFFHYIGRLLWSRSFRYKPRFVYFSQRVCKLLVANMSSIGDTICVFLRCEAPIVLRKQADDTFQVIGECFVHGLHDATALLGPLTRPWTSQLYHDSTDLFTELRFFNPDTDIVTTDDPRLEPLPEE